MTSKLIKVYQETTDFTDGQNGNHIYIFKERMVGRSATAIAYIPRGQTIVHRFKTPMKLDLKGRTFEEIA
jgi:hypothetical protein